MSKWTAVLALLLLNGCATGPRYENFSGADAACIEGDVANFAKFFSEGESHVNIMEVDGLEIRSRPVCVPPGQHKFGVSAYNNYKTANEYFDLNVEPAKKYKMRANLVGISFVFKLLDVTDGQEVQVAEYRVKITSESQPVMVPIVVPSGK